MKFFGKMLILFMGIIVLQSLFIFLLFTNLMEVQNSEDAREEIYFEADYALSRFHADRQRLWESLVRLRGSKLFRSLSHDSPEFNNLLLDLVDPEAVDWIVFKVPGEKSRIINRNYSAFPFEAQPALSRQHSYPHGGYIRWNDSLYYYGSFNFNTSGQDEDLFLIKHITTEYLRGLASRPESRIALYLGEELFISTSYSDVLESFTPPSLAKRRAYNIDETDGTYYIISERVGELGNLHLYDPLTLAVALSGIFYEKRLVMVRQLLLYVALGSTIIAGVIGFIFSRNLSRPAGLLLEAMDTLRHGESSQPLPETAVWEFQELFNRFRKMARTLYDDRIERERYIEEITRLKEVNEQIFESLHSGLIILSTTGGIIRVNRAFLQLFDLRWEETEGAKPSELLPDLFAQPLDTVLFQVLSGKIPSYHAVRRMGGYQVYDIKFYPLVERGDERELGLTERGAWGEERLLIGLIEDITKRTVAEDKLYQAEKLSSISLLTAGVAHEINNPLTSILTNVQLLLEEEGDKEKRESLKWMEQETRRIAGIVRNLLEFAGTKREQNRCNDPASAIDSVIHLLSFAAGKRKVVRFLKEYETVSPLAISCDELKQVAINILRNGIQAMGGGGTILVWIRSAVGLDEGMCMLSFTDFGCGIEEEHLSRVFDPFFTTKGDGNGLGLSLVYGIIEQHGGRVEINSRSGEGTELRILLPAADSEEDDGDS